MTDLPDMAGKEATVWTTEIAPGARTPEHYHPGHVFGYLLEGSLVYTVGQKATAVSAGQAWHELLSGSSRAVEQGPCLIAMSGSGSGASTPIEAPRSPS